MGSNVTMVLKAFCAMTLSLAIIAVAGAHEVHRGSLGASKIQIAEPSAWNGRVLMIAHGYRPVDAPLTAEFDIERPFYATLLDRGWMIAATSYRRNGFLLDEGIEDLAALHDEVARRHGAPQMTLISGSSMGGLIVTRIAESSQERYAGVLALGAYLAVEDLTHAPRIPLLFVSNQSETEGPERYVAKAAKAPVAPVLWTVARDGHVNLNHAEWLAGFDGLLEFVEQGKLEAHRDITLVSRAVSQATFTEYGALTSVTWIDASHGNIDTDLTRADMARLEIAPGSQFVVTFGDQTHRVLFGTTYGDVPRGDWVAFVTAEDRLRIARNFENAAETLGCAQGDELLINPL